MSEVLALTEQLYRLYEEAKLDSLLWSQIRPSGNEQSLPWIVRDLAEVCDLQSILSPLSLDFEAEEIASQAEFKVGQAQRHTLVSRARSLALYACTHILVIHVLFP